MNQLGDEAVWSFWTAFACLCLCLCVITEDSYVSPDPSQSLSSLV